MRKRQEREGKGGREKEVGVDDDDAFIHLYSLTDTINGKESVFEARGLKSNMREFSVWQLKALGQKTLLGDGTSLGVWYVPLPKYLGKSTTLFPRHSNRPQRQDALRSLLAP